MLTQVTAEPAPQERPICGLPVDTDTLFADKTGVRRKSVQKKKVKLLEKLTFLAKFIDADERILYVTTGCSPFTTLEQMTIGYAWVYVIKRALFVFTNKRIFHIPTTTRYAYRGSVSQILYQDCRRQYIKGGSFRVEYQNGQKETFYGIPRADRAAIQRLRIEDENLGPQSARPERNSLCPACTDVLTPGQYTCPHCGQDFKNKADALKYSLLFPGGGYFYVRRWGLGILDAWVESYLLLLTLGMIVVGMTSDPTALPPAALVAVVLAVEKLITVYHSNHFIAEFVPKNLKAIPAERVTPPSPTPAPVPESEAPPAAQPLEPEEQSLEKILSLR